MTRGALVYTLFVLAPSGLLAVLAFRAVDADMNERIAELERHGRDTARTLGRHVEDAIDAALRRPEEPGARAFARAGGSLTYRLDAGPAPPPPSEEDLQLYQTSLRGGESYEHARHDSWRAADAYSFAAPRLRSPELRGRLAFHAARALLASPDAAGDPASGLAILRDVFRDCEGMTAEEDAPLPLDLLAASRLAASGSLEPPLARAARERLARAAPALSTPLLAQLTAVLAPEDTELARLIAERSALEAALRVHPGAISGTPVLGDGFLLVASPVAGSDAREVRRVPIDLPPLEAEGFLAMLAPPGPPAQPRVPAHTVPVRLGEGGPELAVLRLEDPFLSVKLSGIANRRRILLGTVGLLVLFALGGGFALVRYIGRERAVARLKARLLANVSHELRTPLSSIRVFAELLSDARVDPSEARRYAEHLLAETSRLGRLLEDFIEAARTGRSAEEVGPLEPVDLPALVSRIADGYAIRARREGVAFEGRIPGARREGRGLIAVTDAAAVERILSCLLDNAIKYRKKDGPAVSIELEAAGGRARLRIVDNGPGIPRASRERVFEEFYRERYEDFAVQGSGLGLSIARRLARKLGGDVVLEESEEGSGSVFSLELPLAETHEPRPAPPRRG